MHINFLDLCIVYNLPGLCCCSIYNIRTHRHTWATASGFWRTFEVVAKCWMCWATAAAISATRSTMKLPSVSGRVCV